MTPPTVEFHPAAIDEATAAREWFAARSAAAADGFTAELDHAIEQITAAPAQWPPYVHGTRHYVLRRYPYLVVYRELGNTIQIIAVAHARRSPGYWRVRVAP